MSEEQYDFNAAYHNDRFPRSNQYDGKWVAENQMGPNALWLTEWLTEEMPLEAGMRVLDMGCGTAMTSIFLAKEFGVTVFANDLWIAATENWKRIVEAGVADRVFPIHAEAHALPYADDFFDAIVSLDSYQYYGTDDLYLNAFVRFLKPGGQIGIVVPGLMREFPDGTPPEHFTRVQSNGVSFWADDCWSFHTVEWWRTHWGHSSLVEVELADTLEDGCKHWLLHEKVKPPEKRVCPFPPDIECLEADGGRYIGFVRMIARRKEEGQWVSTRRTPTISTCMSRRSTTASRRRPTTSH
ncbi:MAG TPA: methyltransferase domain-containing protein [Planctomycetota bacterium]|nr:methyltransferase domain-containing protein [Planctomycetota bacterium]